MPSAIQLAALHAVVPAAQECMRTWGVPASVTLAQWACESEWGVSELAVECHNYFGVKHVHTNLTEHYQEFLTKEYVNGKPEMEKCEFASYANAVEGFEAHAKLLASLPRYQRAMQNRANVAAFCTNLQLGGYSTSPTYATSLLTLIRQNNLTQYDKLPPDAPAVAQEIAA